MAVRYVPVEKLGAGAFGVVHKAIDRATNTVVAVKVLKSAGEKDRVERFRREARILQEEANNAHVVRLLDYNLDVTQPYLVLEYCDGGSLRPFVGIGANDWRTPALAVGHALLGLAGLHARGGFHRDLKPENLLLRTEPDIVGRRVKVADFGLARVPVTATGVMSRSARGTQGYIAPEVLSKAPSPFDRRCDIYSIGIVGIELLTGHADPGAIITNNVPAKFRSLLASAVASDPSARPDAVAFAGELNRLLQDDDDIQRAAQAPSPPEPGGGQIGLGTIVLGGLVVGAVIAGLAALLKK